jgi:16S rRNA (cytosine1402-N4)-methyltransferase
MILVNDSFAHLQSIVECYSFGPIDGILFDLGVSSLQLTEASRGFSFQVDGPLDMRFNPTGEETAAALINKLGEDELAELLYRYGEERQSRRIARAIVASRPLRSTTELAELIAETIGRRGRLHPATKTFQALRIAVNDELGALEAALPQATAVLASSGRIAVVSFHSLEDRIVKDFFRNESRGCLCPPGVPVCTCHHQPTLRLVTKKPIRPSISEVETNPRSRSARLRIAVRL